MAHRVIVACGDLGDVRPAADFALPFDVTSHSDCGAVGLEPHRVTAACRDLGNVRPVADIALPIEVPSHGDHAAVGLKSHHVSAACGDLGDVPLIADIALRGVVELRGDRGVGGDRECCLPSSHNSSRIQHRCSKNKAEDESDREQNW